MKWLQRTSTLSHQCRYCEDHNQCGNDVSGVQWRCRWRRPCHLKWMFDDTTTKHKHVGKSGRRKKPISGDPRKPSQEQELYCALLFERETALRHEGIDLQIHPSWTWRRYPRFMGMDLVAPVEVRNVRELGDLAGLARQLVLGKTTLAERFPDAVYGRTDWLRELGRLLP